ncbi:hypothetical protein ACQKP1_15930 [Allorhizobium sp. NPDC080224]|uniref:hypothetical protein n=1 Tax=Allorhizobium sp. NPDC080224 TaxID=3390547 RepID=UPI003CFE8B81
MTDEISDDELERRMRKSLFNSTKVETRKKGDREKSKIDPATLAAPGSTEVVRRRSKLKTHYEYYLYSPEYDEPYWLIQRVTGDKREIYRKCADEDDLNSEIRELEAMRQEVRRTDHG